MYLYTKPSVANSNILRKLQLLSNSQIPFYSSYKYFARVRANRHHQVVHIFSFTISGTQTDVQLATLYTQACSVVAKVPLSIFSYSIYFNSPAHTYTDTPTLYYKHFAMCLFIHCNIYVQLVSRQIYIFCVYIVVAIYKLCIRTCWIFPFNSVFLFPPFSFMLCKGRRK